MKKIILVLSVFFICFQTAFCYEMTVENCKIADRYQKELINKIKSNWNLKNVSSDLSTVIKIKTDKNGKFEDIIILKSSLNHEFDNSAKEAVLLSIDKNDELLRFYDEFTFYGDKTLKLTNFGVSDADRHGFYLAAHQLKEILNISEKKAKSNPDKNLYLLLKVNKDGTVLNKELLDITNPSSLTLNDLIDNLDKVPKLKNIISNEYYILVSYTKYSTIPSIVFAGDKNYLKQRALTAQWLEECIKIIEKMWQATNYSYFTSANAQFILNKNGTVKEVFVYENYDKESTDNVASFIIKNVTLPAPNPLIFYDNYYLNLVFREDIRDGKFISNSLFLAYSVANCGPYMTALEKKIKSNWNPPRRGTSKRVVVMFYVQKDGNIENISVIQSSNDPDYDNAAINAIKSSIPVEPLPDEFSGTSVPVEFTFDYNVFDTISNSYVLSHANPDKSNPNKTTVFDLKINAIYQSYINDVKKRIEDNWQPTATDKTKAVEIMIKINKEGKLSGVEKIKTSDNQNFDNAAINAVKKTVFSPLPKKYPVDTLNVNLIFQKSTDGTKCIYQKSP